MSFEIVNLKDAEYSVRHEQSACVLIMNDGIRHQTSK